MKLMNLLRGSKPNARANDMGRKTRAVTLSLESLEERKVLSTFASSGPYAVSVFTNRYSPTDTDIYATLTYNGQTRATVPIETSSLDETNPSVSINSNGTFVVAYEQRYSSIDRNIRVRQFSFQSGSQFGVRLADQLVSGDAADESQPSTAINQFGQYAVSYTRQYSATDTDLYVYVNNRLVGGGAPSSVAMLTYNPLASGTYAVATSTSAEYNSQVALTDSGAVAVSYTRRFSATDTDVYATVIKATSPYGSSNPTYSRNQYAIATSSGNENTSAIDSFDGRILTVSYTLNGNRYRRIGTI